MTAIGQLFIAQQPSALDGTVGTLPNLPTGTAASLAAAISAISAIQQRINGMQPTLRSAVQSGAVLSAITLSDEQILITSDNIAMVGGVVFADWQRDVNGVASGTVDPSITRIRGGVIQTQKILSFDTNSYMDLDATGSAVFIKCQSAVSILANGHFTFGAAGGSQLTFDGSTLTFQGDINTSGKGVFGGAATSSGNTWAGIFNSGLLAQGGAVGYTSTVIGLYGIATGANGQGVVGTASGNGGIGVGGSGTSGTAYGGYFSAGSSGIGCVAQNTGTGTALSVLGNMAISSTTLITNLNANWINGVGFPGATTGTSTGTLVLTGKPGANSNSIWGALSINFGGTTYDIPLFPR